MIAVVDYQMGNVGSIVNMLKRSGHAVALCSASDEIDRASKLILPGVGSFDTGMANLGRLGLRELLDRKVAAGTPVLGICLGMQLLFEGSEEGREPGLGWLRGRCVRFSFEENAKRLKIPHMGWNTVQPSHRESLFRGMTEDAGYYFVHSYHAVCSDASDALATTMHGYEFVSSVQRGAIFGTQFHPEKSHRHGKQLLTNFAEL